jgi:flagellar hook-length control protein FliK
MVLHRGPQRVAVGVRDPGLGWTEIHAESTAGQISAVVATASTAAHASLASHLPSLTQFLSDHNVQVGSVTVEHGLRGGADGYTGNDGNGPGSNPGGGMAQPGASQQEQAQSSAGQRADAREMHTSGGAAGGVFAGGGGSRVHVIA